MRNGTQETSCVNHVVWDFSKGVNFLKIKSDYNVGDFI